MARRRGPIERDRNGRFARKAAKAKRRADFRRREDAFARGAQGSRAYG